MRIILSGFKCYSSKTFEIPDENLILIKGPSGNGKSTIFTAISWCLYGNQRNVDPLNSQGKTKLSVNLEWKGYNVYRQKRPNLLKLTFKGQTHEDAIAQSTINDIFGTPDIWPVVSHIPQGCHNALISSSVTERIEMINTLAFTGENPERVIERICQMLRETTVKFNLLNDVYNRELQELNDFLAENEVNVESEMSVEEIKKLEDLIPELQVKIEKLQETQLRSHQSRGVIKNLQENLTQLRIELDHFLPTSETSIGDFEREIDLLNSKLEISLQREGLISEIKILESQLPSIDKTTVEIQEECEQLQIEIENLTSLIQYETRRTNLISEIENLKSQLPFESTSTSHRIPEEIANIQERLQRDISNYKDRIRLAIEREELVSKWNSLKSQIPIVTKTPGEIKIKIEEINLSVQHLNEKIQSVAQRERLVSDVTSLKSQLPIVDKNSDEIKLFQGELKREIESLNYKIHLVIQREKLESEISTLKSQLPNIDKTSHEFRIEEESLIEEIGKLNEGIRLATQRERVITELISIKSQFPSNIKVIPREEIEDARRKILKYREMITVVSRFSLPYDFETIQNLIKYDRGLIEVQPMLRNYDRVTKLNALIVPVEHVEISHLENLREKLNIMELSRDVLQCPHCSGSVRFMDRRLVLSKERPVTEEAILDLKSEIFRIEKNLETQLKNNQYQSEIDRLELTPVNENYRLLPENTIRVITDRLVQLEKVEFVSPPEITLEEISQLDQFLSLSPQIDLLERQLTQYPQDSLTDLQELLVFLEKSLKEVRHKLVLATNREIICREILQKEEKCRELPTDSLIDLQKSLLTFQSLSEESQHKLTLATRFEILVSQIIQAEKMILEFPKDHLETLREEYSISLEVLEKLYHELTLANKFEITSQEILSLERKISQLHDESVTSLNLDLTQLQDEFQKSQHEMSLAIKFQTLSLQISHRTSEMSQLIQPTNTLHSPKTQALLKIPELKDKLNEKILALQKSQGKIHLAIKFQTLKSQISLREEQLSSIISGESSGEIRDKLNQARENFEEHKIRSGKVFYLRGEILRNEGLLNHEETQYIDVDDNLKEIKDFLEETTKRVKMAKIANWALNKSDEVSARRDDLLELETRLDGLERIKRIAVDVEHLTLQSTIDSINSALADIGSSLFDEPISIIVSLFKTTKTTGQTKPSVNLSIHYKGGDYTSVFELSGGEADRVSLALTLALAQLSSSPFLLLDESLASLNPDIKELCTKAIRQYAGDKTVICINHECVEGHYDYILEL